MDLSHGYCMVAVCLALTGRSDGVGVLPDRLSGAVGESVMLKVDQSSPMISVAWQFHLANGTVISILTSTVETTTTPEYSTRTKFDNITGSLELSILTLNDTGLYKVMITPPSGHPLNGECNLQMYERVSGVTVTPNTTELLEFSSSVRMSCQVSTGTSLSYLWMNGSSEITVSSDRVQVGDGNTTLTILNVTRYDRGPYTCNVSNLISTQESAPLKLHPIYGPVSIQIYVPVDPVEIGQILHLSCRAESTPPAHFTWINGMNEELGSGADFKKTATLLDSGEYTCLAVNNITKLELRAVQSISVTDNSLSSGAIAGIAIAVILAVVLVAALIYRVHTSRTGKRKEKFNVSERGSSNGGYSQDSALSTQNMNYADISHFKKNQDVGMKMQNPHISTIYSETKPPAT
ncbi:carcinoembryonic antigen-related cell adhesion molecule 6 [Gadus macrocephalus]|uniref:carcinoembryonic antigen-related cell adhesion molecule 6 n=1 Tax=Gadus macrocephalus TaxID=80720 RepID=UPI0028CBA11A|nr:carcinoembryonic antigen-related cell adhesion molecule 6 [Gadus macrocephalus]